MKPNPTCSMQAATPSGRRSMRAPSASSRSAEPDRPVAERLPCLATAQPAAAAISAAVVETLNVRRPPPVPAVSSRSSRLVRTCVGERAHGARETGELVDRLALRTQGDQDAGDLRLGRLAVHDLLEHALGLVDGQVAAEGERVDGAGEDLVRHRRRSVRARPAGRPPAGSWPAAACRAAVSTDSGWNCTPSAGSSRWRMPISTPPPRAVSTRQSGSSSSTTSE